MKSDRIALCVPKESISLIDRLSQSEQAITRAELCRRALLIGLRQLDFEARKA